MLRLFRPNARRRGFTLVEMLVVIGIIGVLAALLLPAIMSAITRARNTVIALEIKQLDTAIEAYRLEKGDYPPNFRNPEAVRRHITKCYPKIDPTYFTAFMKQVFPPDGATVPAPTAANIDESESLVFWLSMTDTNSQFPFLSLKIPAYTATLPAANPKKFYDFDQTRLTATLNTDVPSFKAKFCGDTFYMYIDSRSYVDLCRFSGYGTDTVNTYAYADDTGTGVRPYWSFTKNPSAPTSGAGATLVRNVYKPMNPNTFQIICAGQDGDFGFLSSDSDVKVFPNNAFGIPYNQGDKDNIANFSQGKTLGYSIP